MFHRVLVTGANGLVGQALVQRLSSEPSVDLLATGREAAPRFTAHSGGYLSLDITDAKAIRATFEDFAPSVVVHAAAMSKVEACDADRDLCWQTNVEAVQALASACRAQGSRLILLSTDFVFDGQSGPYEEDDRPAPVNFYGRSKLAAENVLREVGPARWAIARTCLVFGTGEDLARRNVATFLLERLALGEAVTMPVDQIRTPTYAPDLAEGLFRLIVYKKHGIFHLSGRERMSVHAFGQRLATAFGYEPLLVEPIASEVLHPGHPRPLATGFVTVRAEAELGVRPRSLEAAFQHLGQQLGLPVSCDDSQT